MVHTLIDRRTLCHSMEKFPSILFLKTEVLFKEDIPLISVQCTLVCGIRRLKKSNFFFGGGSTWSGKICPILTY